MEEMTDERSVPSQTVSADYGDSYFTDGHLGPPYTYQEPHWQRFFGGIAQELVALLAPVTFYDAGCAKGFLVRAMADLGVEARGGDLSADAIAGAPPGLAERLEVKDLTEPLDRRYDLITCIEVLEHMAPPAAHAAIRHLCAATDVLLMSSTPSDFAEATHVNVRQPADWAVDFATQGFYRRTDLDASFVSPWAVIYQRSASTPAQLVGAYEGLLAPLHLEVVAKRAALLDAQRALDQAREPVNRAVAGAIQERDRALAERDLALAERDRLAARIESSGVADLDAERMNRLAMADELIGARAELALIRIQTENAVVEAGREAVRLREVLGSTRAELESVISHAVGLERMVADIRASATWRVGRTLMLPVRVVRLPLRLARRVARRVKRILTR